MEEKLCRSVIELVRLHGADETHLINDLFKVGHAVCNPLPAFARLMERIDGAHQLGDALKERKIGALQKLFGDGLAIEFAEFRLVVEKLKV